MQVIVVGAGIAGLSTAWALTRRGHQVTLLEQGSHPQPARGFGRSSPHHPPRLWQASGYGRAITEAYRAWDELWSDLGESHHDPRGFLCISREAGRRGRTVSRRPRGGAAIPSSCSRREAAAERWPFLEPGTFRYAFVSPEGGALHCRKIASGIAGWLRSNGAAVYENSKVAAIEPDTGKVELAGGETLRADLVVVTAGAWVLKLFPDLEGELKTYRTAVVYLDPPADLASAWQAAPVILDVGGRDRRLHHPALRRRRAEVRVRPAQGADQRCRLEPRSRSKARARRSATCFRRRSRGSPNTR